MHIKTVYGKKYYYNSVRKGEKVISVYVKPVEKVRETKINYKAKLEKNK